MAIWHAVVVILKSLLTCFQRQKTMLSPLSMSFSQLVWSHEEQQEIGKISMVKLILIREDGTDYLLKPSDEFECSITHIPSKTPVEYAVLSPLPLVGRSEVRVEFTAQKLGTHCVEMRINGGTVAGGPTHRTFIAGPLDVAMTELAPIPSTKIAVEGVYFTMKLFPRDRHGNPTTVSGKCCEVDIVKHGAGKQVSANHELFIRKTVTGHGYELCVKLKERGVYEGTVKNNGKVVGQRSFTIICLTNSEARSVRTNAQEEKQVSYKAKMVEGGKLTEVHCRFTSQVLEVCKERTQIVYTCPISPTRKVSLLKADGAFLVDNGSDDPVHLISKDRNLVAATFSKFCLRNMGGFECFKKKESFLYDQLQKLSHAHREILTLLVDRKDILNSAIRATKKLSAADWWKKFAIEFVGEDGQDCGGLSRAFFYQLSCVLFSGQNSCFIRLDEDTQQAPVHPNPDCTCYQHFELAGKLVGKSLLEGALGNTLPLKVNFSQSFLAQVLGLKVGYCYYENDDPTYYRNKIQLTLTQDVTDAGLFFTDSADDSVALVRDGRKRKVTEEDKRYYLNQLAHYRLARRPSKQIKHFIQGLKEIIPSNLLLIFTVAELELLLCGTCEVTYEDMKAHAQVEGDMADSSTLDYFWRIVKGFTPDEIADLLQFVTGSSVLPQGGFETLRPPFSISVTPPQKGRLPSSHTCINQLYIPQCESKEQLQVSLLRALKENAFLLC